MSRVYRGSFSSWQDIAQSFAGVYDWSKDHEKAGALALVGSEPEAVWAEYDQSSYEGSALIVFRRDGKWWHVHASHCSCNGLEDCWTPEEFDPKDHFAALAQGKRLIAQYSVNESAFNSWLKKECEA